MIVDFDVPEGSAIQVSRNADGNIKLTIHAPLRLLNVNMSEEMAEKNKLYVDKNDRRCRMTIDEAIQHCEEKAKELKADTEVYKRVKATPEHIAKCEECAREHEQLAEWLKELKSYRECDLLRDECSFCGDKDCICKKGDI